VEGYLAALGAGIPIKIHGEHGTFERSYLKDKLQKFLWKKFDSVTVVVGDLEKKLREIFNYKAKNVRIIYNGTDHTKFYPSQDLRKEFRKKYGLEGFFLVGTVGRFYKVKDHFTLIRGFKHFRSLIPNTKLVLVGGDAVRGDKYKERYVQLIEELGLNDDVVIIPPVTDPETVMNTFDIFVLSSISEGCSNVILEAMACGIPLVVTNTGGNPELVKDHDNGLLFEVGNDKELAEKLQYLYDHPEVRERFSRQNIKLVKEKFSLGKTIFNYEKLYSDLYNQKVNGKLIL
jgi:glycosyltransferase involved in cell wall biosynthesis